MIKPDCLVSWPLHLDYPLWRQFIRDNRNKFNKVIIIFTQMNAGEDYREFIRQAMIQDDVILEENKEVGAHDDWRNNSVNRALHFSDSPWVFFTEQDFFPKEGFWEEVKSLYKIPNIVGFGAWISQRLHPCCLFVKRKEIEKTTKYFGVVRDKLDHFGQFQNELLTLGPVLEIPNETHFHYHALSQNMYMLYKGETPNFRPEEFKTYLQECLKVNVPLDPRFVKLAKSYI